MCGKPAEPENVIFEFSAIEPTPVLLKQGGLLRAVGIFFIRRGHPYFLFAGHPV
jgi:hypothetical protein